LFVAPRSSSFLGRTVQAAFAGGLVAAALLAGAGPAAAAGCTKVAAPTGSDSNPGTETAPFQTAQRLVKSLDAGQTGCLRAGTYGGSDLRMQKPDTALQSYPGERATLTAFLEVYPTAPRARISGLKIDTTTNSNDVGTKLQADDVVFSDNEVTKGGQGICILAGTFNPAQRIVIERNRIYNCGSGTKPDGSHNKFDHLIYLSGTRNAVIRWNILTDNAGGWGVHMYPDADGTVVEHNIIDGNQGGVIFAGTSGLTSDGNVVRNNAITSDGPRWNLEGSWSGEPPGTGNSATANCVHTTGPSQPSGISYRHGFSESGNAVLNGSPYVNAAAGDYRFKDGSACTALVGDVVGAVNGTPSTPPPPAPAPAPKDRLEIVIVPGKQRIAPLVPIPVSGKVLATRPSDARRVALQVKTRRGGWRTVARRMVRNGRFAAKLRTRRTARGRRVVRLRAVVPGRASSRIVRVKVAKRAKSARRAHR
jgi:hypothetical protein